MWVKKLLDLRLYTTRSRVQLHVLTHVHSNVGCPLEFCDINEIQDVIAVPRKHPRLHGQSMGWAVLFRTRRLQVSLAAFERWFSFRGCLAVLSLPPAMV